MIGTATGVKVVVIDVMILGSEISVEVGGGDMDGSGMWVSRNEPRKVK